MLYQPTFLSIFALFTPIMSLIPLVCPKCGANIELNDTLEVGYCSYCGTKVLVQEALGKRKTDDRSHEIPSLLELAGSALEAGDPAKCGEYADSAIMIKADCGDAWYLKGCAMAAQGNRGCIGCWERAAHYCGPDTDTGLKARKALEDPDGHIRIPTRKFKVIVERAGKLIQPTIAFYVDKAEVLRLKGGDMGAVDITKGKHLLSIKQPMAMFMAWKTNVLVEDRDVVLRLTYDSDRKRYDIGLECRDGTSTDSSKDRMLAHPDCCLRTMSSAASSGSPSQGVRSSSATESSYIFLML